LWRGSMPILLQREAILPRLVSGLGQRQLALLVADLGEFHLGALAIGRGEAERPDALAALAHDQVKPAAIGMGAGLLGFNLVRIQRHFRLCLGRAR